MGYIMDLRKVVGKRPLIMASAGTLIFNKKGDVLLQQRTDNHKWGLPGGSMELGETFEEVAIREAKEEVGLTIRNLKIFNVYSGKELHYIYPNGDEIYNAAVVYECREFEGKIVKDEEETLDVRFFSIEELPDLTEINPPDVVIIKDVIRMYS